MFWKEIQRLRLTTITAQALAPDDIISCIWIKTRVYKFKPSICCLMARLHGPGQIQISREKQHCFFGRLKKVARPSRDCVKWMWTFTVTNLTGEVFLATPSSQTHSSVPYCLFSTDDRHNLPLFFLHTVFWWANQQPWGISAMLRPPASSPHLRQYRRESSQ